MHQLITKVKSMLSSISNGLEYWSVNHIAIYQKCELNNIEDIRFCRQISNN